MAKGQRFSRKEYLIPDHHPRKTEVKVYFLDECEYVDFVRRVLPSQLGFVKSDAIPNSCHSSTVCHAEEPPLPRISLPEVPRDNLQCPTQSPLLYSKAPVIDIPSCSQCACETENLPRQLCPCRHVQLPNEDSRFRAPRLKCARCRQVVYPLEELKILGRSWHKSCFRCTVCGRLLQLMNYKEFEKLPYCCAHWPVPQPTYFEVTDDWSFAGPRNPPIHSTSQRFRTPCENEYGNYQAPKPPPNRQFYTNSVGSERHSYSDHQRLTESTRQNEFSSTRPIKIHDTDESFLRSVENMVENEDLGVPWRVYRNAFTDHSSHEEEARKKGWFRRLGDAILN